MFGGSVLRLAQTDSKKGLQAILCLLHSLPASSHTLDIQYMLSVLHCAENTWYGPEEIALLLLDGWMDGRIER